MVGTRKKQNSNSGSISNSKKHKPPTGYDSKATSIGLKVMIKQISELSNEERDDFDYYEPTKELKQFSKEMLFPLDALLEFSDESRDPSEDNNTNFKYVEISSIDAAIAKIADFNVIPCDKDFVPSRARKVIHKDDIIISTVRPTRRAIAKVPRSLENEICSTGFEVVRPKRIINRDYLLFVLRTPLVEKQFGKFASGSSYPAILKKHIQMTIVPVPNKHIQRTIAEKMNQTFSQIKLLNKEISKVAKHFEKESTEILKEK